MTRLPISLTTLTASLALAACSAKAPLTAPPPPVSYAEAILYDGQGVKSGRVTLTPRGETLAGTIEVKTGLTPGAHGMHIHAVGQCTLPDFASAGPHLNPGGHQHGTANPMGPHAGDLPALQVGADGTAQAAFVANTTLEQLFDADGAAFVVHAAPDDMKTDPSGNSGARILCGVLYAKQG